jgi:hypothetical protein
MWLWSIKLKTVLSKDFWDHSSRMHDIYCDILVSFVLKLKDAVCFM